PVCYPLGGGIDEQKGWGLTGETFHALDQIARFGEPVWFNLGARDLATHLHRTRLLREGRTLTQITRAIAQALGVSATLLPMSDQPVRTRILGPDGWLAFQEYFVREKAQVEVRAVNYAGAPVAARRRASWTRSAAPARSWSAPRTRSRRSVRSWPCPDLAAPSRLRGPPV